MTHRLVSPSLGTLRRLIPPPMAQRDTTQEVMEDPALPRADLDHALQELRRMNRLFGGIRMSTREIRETVEGQSAFSLLDVGCGDGEIPRQMALWARAQGVGFEGLGIDLTPASVELARALTPKTLPLAFKEVNLFDLEDSKGWDVVHTSLVMHHLGDDEIVRALRKMLRLCRLAVVVNDLHRSPLAWAGAKLGARLVTDSHVVRADAPHSVRRAFARGELEALAKKAGATKIKIAWKFPFRWILRLEP